MGECGGCCGSPCVYVSSMQLISSALSGSCGKCAISRTARVIGRCVC
uniref:Uncharacterized protein n=1 Tax=Arundo donax TaxID=35708 RepID=A0A0A9A8I0_ARUDO